MANYFGGYSQPQNFQQYQPYQQSNNTVIVVPVQGESGASMYPVAAGNTVVLMDFNAKRFWIKATDFNGLPAKFAAFDFSEVKPVVQNDTQNFVSRNEFEEWKQGTDAQLQKILESVKSLVGGNGNVPITKQPATAKSVPATI